MKQTTTTVTPSTPVDGVALSHSNFVTTPRSRTFGKPGPALEEALVADTRANMTPAQMVERKLLLLLRDQPLPVSQRLTTRRR